MRNVVCDAGPIIHLHEADLLSLLRRVGDIFLPDTVALEVSSITDLADRWPEWLQVVKLASSDSRQAESWSAIGDLHKGEAEAFVLARIKEADWLLTDDSTARLFALLVGLEVHGSLGVVLWNVAKGYLSRAEADQALSGLEQSSLWLSPRIFKKARNAIIDMTS